MSNPKGASQQMVDNGGKGVPPNQGQRAKAITQTRQRSPTAQGNGEPPPCPCCSARAQTREVIRRGLECVECSYVIWERPE